MARLLRLLLAAQLALAVVLVMVAAPRLHSVWLASWLALASLLLLRLLLVLNSFRLSWRYRAAETLRLPWRQQMRMVGAEWCATMLSSSWQMAWPRLTAYDGAAGLPVLLVHGYACNRAYWTACSAMLRQAGISHAALDCEPLGASIDAYVVNLERVITALCRSSGSQQVILLGHSMGGLTIRAYLRVHGSARVAHVVTLGTPHHGTVLANFAIGENAQQMARSASAPSAWLTALAASEDSARRALFTSIYSLNDNIIVPASSACLPGAKNIALDGVGHVALGSDARVLQCLLDELRLIHPQALIG